MHIGIDIDEVLCETLDFALHFSGGKIGGKPLSRKQVSDYYLPNIPGYEDISPEIAVSFFVNAQNSPRALQELQPVQGALEKLTTRKAEGHLLYAITARGEPVREATETRLAKYFPDIFDKIIFCNHYWKEYPTYSKEEIAKQEEIRLFVEDNPKYAIALESLGIKVFLLEKPRNQSFISSDHPRIIKVSGRNEIKI